MALAPLHRCNEPGCRALIRDAARCPLHRHKRAPRREKETDKHAYGYIWQVERKAYKAHNRLCVACLFNNRITPVEALDHIAPITCLPEQQWDSDNWCSICWPCHNRKTAQEPKQAWIPESDRWVICGLPASGKSTEAKAMGFPYFDADEHGLTQPDAIAQARARWLAQHKSGPVAIIVSHPTAASQVAYEARARVKHMAIDETERAKRLQNRAKASG